MTGTACGGHIQTDESKILGFVAGNGEWAVWQLLQPGPVSPLCTACGVHTGGIGLDGTNRMDAWRCRLSCAMAGPAGLSLAAGVNRRAWFARQGHGMYFAMTTRT